MKHNTHVQTLGLFLVLLFTSSISFSQEINEKDVEKSRLEKEYAENQKAIAEAKKAELEARFPVPDADALKATTSVEGNLIEARIQAYKAIDEITKQIALDAETIPITRLYIFREDEYARMVAFKRLRQRLELINAEYDRCYPGRPNPAPGLGAFAPMILEWAALLITDTKLKGTEFDIEEEAAWASLGKNLAAVDITLTNSFITSHSFDDVTGLSGSKLFSLLQSAEDSLTSGPCSNTSYAFKTSIDTSFTALKREIGLERTEAVLEKTEKKTEEVTGPPKTVTETTTKTPSSSPNSVAISFWDYLIAEKVHNYVVTNRIHWIKFKVSKAGGNIRTKSSPLIDLFRGGNSVAFSGGAIAYYYILDNAGVVKKSGVVTSYVPYRKSSNVTKPQKGKDKDKDKDKDEAK